MVFGRKVSPVATSQPHIFFIMIGIMDRVFHVLLRHWNSLQIGHRGRYSVERLLAFRDYYERTSPTRAFVVCVLSLLPAFVVAILVEFIPLRPPTESWKNNYAFWIRLYVSSLPIAFGGVFQVKEVIQPGVISTTGIIATAVGSCTCYAALTMAVAAAWKFPIPFGYVLTIGPFVAFYMIFFMLSIGPRVLAKSPILRSQIFSQMLVIAAQGTLAIAYSTFGAIFNQLSGHAQTKFVFVLPFIKFSIKQFIAKVSAHLHEYVGPTVVLTVDVCNVLYVAICVQTAVSPLTTTLMISSDACFVLLALRSIYSQTNVVAPGLRATNVALSSKNHYIQDLLTVIHGAFQSAGETGAFSVPLRIRAPFPLHLSSESTKFLNELLRSRQKNTGSVDFDASLCVDGGTATSTAWVGNRFHKSQSAPSVLDRAACTSSCRISSTQSLAEPVRAQVAVENAHDSLQSLFHSEYVLMAEFIESIIPVLYAIYLVFLYNLPTAAYYPHTRALTPGKFASTQRNIMLYAAVEFGSFIGMNLVLKRKCGFSPLYQLAFVFETQALTIQSHLFVWVLCILQITLVHNGVDLEAPFK